MRRDVLYVSAPANTQPIGDDPVPSFVPRSIALVGNIWICIASRISRWHGQPLDRRQLSAGVHKHLPVTFN